MNKIELLREGQTGFGLLIEQDAGHIERNSLKILKEDAAFSIEELPNPFYVDAILQRANTENKNGRIYPRDILEREVNRYKDLIKQGLSTSEANHPETSNIDVLNIPHLITDIWWDGDIVMGKLMFLTSPGYHKYGVESNPADRIVNMMWRGVKVGISSRGVGSVKKVTGKDVVQDDFELICFDIVSTPSTPGAYLFPKFNKPDASMHESASRRLDALNNFLLD